MLRSDEVTITGTVLEINDNNCNMIFGNDVGLHLKWAQQ